MIRHTAFAMIVAGFLVLAFVALSYPQFICLGCAKKGSLGWQDQKGTE